MKELLSGVNFQGTYRLGESYASIKARAIQILGKYLDDPSVIAFKDAERSVTFTTERLIPIASTHRPRLVLLFSNPHPHSIRQGMFHAPIRRGAESLFWSVMREAGWIRFAEENPTPLRRADDCLHGRYDGPFEYVFTCYYAFPTAYPEDIRKIFGKEYFEQEIEPESKDEFRKVIRETSPQAVVTFNKGIFNLVTHDRIERYIERLMDGEVIRSQIDGAGRAIPIYLSFPTGWRYHRQFREYHKASLEAIGRSIEIQEQIT